MITDAPELRQHSGAKRTGRRALEPHSRLPALLRQPPRLPPPV